MEWTPDVDTVGQVLMLLQALRDPTCASHQEALQTLTTDTANPTFVLHLVHVFSRGGEYEGIHTDIRQLAGLITKNYVFPRLVELSEDVFSIVKLEIVHGLSDPVVIIRNTAGLLIGRITASFMMNSWTDILETLLGGAIILPDNHAELHSENSPLVARIDGALLAIKRICEDSAEKLYMDIDNRCLETLIPQLLAVFDSPVTSHRLKAIESINALIYLIPSSGNNIHGTPCALISHMSTFLSSLSQMAADPNASVRRAVCQALVLLTSFQIAVLAPMLGEVCMFMLQNIRDKDDSVAMEACDFWWEFLKDNEATEFLLVQHENASGESVLSNLIPSLISRFPLTQEQIEFDREEDEATASGDKEVNFKPIHYASKSPKGDDDASENNEGDVNEETGGVSLWTLRRQAARVLDLLAYSIPPNITLSIALPVVQANFSHTDVWVYETGMMTLGALSHGCSDDMAEYLPDLLPILLSSVYGQRVVNEQSQDLPHEVQCASCWVIGRYSEYWFTDGDNVEIQKSILEVLLGAMMSNIPRLQSSACSALTAVFESVGASEDPHFQSINILDICLSEVLTQFNEAFGIYGIKNSLVLCDTIGTFCEAIAPNSLQTIFSSSDNSYSRLILEPLLRKFSFLMQTPDPMAEGRECAPNPHLFPVLECLSSVSLAVGLDMLPFITELVKSLLQLICSVMDAHTNHFATLDSGQNLEDVDELPDIDFAVCSLDVISSMVEGVKVAFPVVVLNFAVDTSELSLTLENLQEYCQSDTGIEVQEVLISQLLRCLGFRHSSDVRQSAFSLAGDLVSEGACAALFATPLSTQITSSFPPIVSNVDVAVNLMDESFMNLCSDEPVQGGQFFLTPCCLYIFQLSICQIDPQSALEAPLVANNAVWLIGEYCLAIGSGDLTDILVQPLSHQVTVLLHQVMTLDGTSTSAIQTLGQEENYSPLALKQNLAIALGRMAFLSPVAASCEPNPLLNSTDSIYLQNFCSACSLLQESVSKDHAYLGLISLLNVQPQALLGHGSAIEQFCIACISWEAPPCDPEILAGLRDILVACMGTSFWDKVMKKLKGSEHLYHTFQLA